MCSRCHQKPVAVCFRCPQETVAVTVFQVSLGNSHCDCSRCPWEIVAVCSKCPQGTVAVCSRCPQEPVAVCSRYHQEIVAVCSWCPRETVAVTVFHVSPGNSRCDCVPRVTGRPPELGAEERAQSPSQSCEGNRTSRMSVCGSGNSPGGKAAGVMGQPRGPNSPGGVGTAGVLDGRQMLALVQTGSMTEG